jgi:hypothetical protein
MWTLAAALAPGGRCAHPCADQLSIGLKIGDRGWPQQVE